MVETNSTMLPLGTNAPYFSLADSTGKIFSLDDFRDSAGLVMMFICNHCPFVIHIRSGIAQYANDYSKRGLAIVGINSNDATQYPADRPEKMLEEAKRFGYRFPYLFDETQEVAKAYHAACTPDFFLFSWKDGLIYRGQFDASRPSNQIAVTGEDLRNASDKLLNGEKPLPKQTPSIGCNIKWKPGNEPDYFL